MPEFTAEQRIEQGTAAWERHDYETALDEFRTVLDKHPDFPDVRNKAGLCLAMLGEMDDALEEFDRALGIAPDYAEAHLNRAIVLNTLGRFEEAGEAFQRAGELDRRDGRTLSELGNRIAVTHAKLGDLYMEAEYFEEAVREYENALDVRPRFLDIRSRLGEALLGLGELDRARKELETILDGHEGFTGARLRLGVVLLKQGHRKRAIAQWERCLEERPRDLRARAYLASARNERKEAREEEAAPSPD